MMFICSTAGWSNPKMSDVKWSIHNALTFTMNSHVTGMLHFNKQQGTLEQLNKHI